MKYQEITTTDLSEFGWRERHMAAELLTASCDQGLPDDFNDDAVTIMMNKNSGNVFLTNSDYQEIGVQTGHDFAATDASENPGECVNCGAHCDSDEAKERCPEF